MLLDQNPIQIDMKMYTDVTAAAEHRFRRKFKKDRKFLFFLIKIPKEKYDLKACLFSQVQNTVYLDHFILNRGRLITIINWNKDF